MKTNQTFISVSIPTEYTHERGNEFEQARQQIELSSFYLQSLFNSIKHSAAHFESHFDEQGQEFCNDLRNLAEIGYSVSGSIFASLSVFEPDFSQRIENKIDTDSDFNHFDSLEDAPTDTLALALSEVLRNENLPTDIHIALQNALNDAYNGGIPDAIKDYESSPEYLKAILEACKENDDENDD